MDNYRDHWSPKFYQILNNNSSKKESTTVLEDEVQTS